MKHNRKQFENHIKQKHLFKTKNEINLKTLVKQQESMPINENQWNTMKIMLNTILKQ